ncbi:Uncharacterised protein [Actinobacillus porcinus]|uniref:Uncharacterized protein n=1 Tax=Actinobacillus porcinus TaxID=51048 RepID=A0ABY6TJ02_9PAST|nr:hypothetical protein [Actinobacillus porcinus]VFY92873.1 Uncharacterised protein [Actinobacillus porcinus]VTU07341.1 Uncharacterised protein [Actinobacillus porcinus]
MSYKQKLLTALEHYQKLINGMYSIRELLNQIESIYQQDTTTLPPRSLNRPYEELPGSEITTEVKIFRFLYDANLKSKGKIKEAIVSLSCNETLAISTQLENFLEEKASNDDLNEVINIVYKSDESDDKELINARIQEYINKVS